MAAAANAPSRVGIIGAGIAAAACARALAAVGVRSTVYEQGRSAGGRLATRRSRARKGKQLAINHGAPAFTARGPEFKRMVAALEAEGAVEEWSDATLGILHQQRGLEIVKPPGLRLYRGRPTMSALAEKMLAASAPFCDQQYGDLIQRVSLDPAPVDAQQRWRLSTRSGACSNHEFLVVASSLPANSGRWKGIFGDEAEAPLVEALSSALAAAEASTGPAAGQQQQLEELQAAASAIASVGSVPTQPVLSVMVAWGGVFGPEAAAYAEAWLPCELMEVKDHPVLQKVVRQPQPDGGVALILHSTHEFAAAHPKAYGRQSSVATSGMLDPELAATAAAMEEGVARKLWTALHDLWGDELLPLPDPPQIEAGPHVGMMFMNMHPGHGDASAMGLTLHRWGGAFAAPAQGQLSSSECWQQPYGLAFCGDYVRPASPECCHVEVAATSGLAAARRILDAISGAGAGGAAGGAGGSSESGGAVVRGKGEDACVLRAKRKASIARSTLAESYPWVALVRRSLATREWRGVR
jgi:predicted NAD/FAD-dependent oxidoreductase